MRGDHGYKAACLYGDFSPRNGGNSRPWVDKRDCVDVTFEVKPISDQTVLNALKRMERFEPSSYRRFFTNFISPIVSDEACIEYFSDSSVIVVDRKGRQWLRGKRVIELGGWYYELHTKCR